MHKAVDDSEIMTGWQLYHVAEALTRAKRLEKLRSDFHNELYASIAFPSVNYDALNPRTISTATEAQAIRIIEAKERYDSLIQQEYVRHVRWKNLLEWASSTDKELMIRYFQKKKYVHPEVIAALLHRIKGKVEEEEIRIEKERTVKAQKDFKKYLDMVDRKRLKQKKKVCFFEKSLMKSPSNL